MAATQNGHQHQHGDNDKPVDHSVKPHDMDDDDSKMPTMLSYVQRYVDRIVSPQWRKQVYDSVSQFAIARPILFFFIATQIVFSAPPLLAFLTFVLCALIFSLVGALITTLFLTGVALMFLIPTLFVTSFIGILAWSWIAGSFVVARWLYPHAFVSSALPAKHGEGASVNGIGNGLEGETKKSDSTELKKHESNGDYVIDPDY